MNELPVITQVEKVRRAHCTYCDGKGTDLQFEWVKSSLGTSYRIPLSHTQCKQSVLSLSLSLSLDPIPSPPPKREGSKKRKKPSKGVTHEKLHSIP